MEIGENIAEGPVQLCLAVLNDDLEVVAYAQVWEDNEDDRSVFRTEQDATVVRRETIASLWAIIAVDNAGRAQIQHGPHALEVSKYVTSVDEVGFDFTMTVETDSEEEIHQRLERGD